MPCAKNLPEDKLKSFGIISLARKFQEPNIEPVTWFLVITSMQFYNEKEQVVQKELRNVQLKEKRSIWILMLELRLVLREIRRDLIQNGIERMMPLGKDSTQLTFQLYKENT